MLSKKIIMGFLGVLGTLFSCNTKTEYKSVEVAEFETIISDTAIVRLDVRTPEEYAEGHIEGARNIDVTSADFESKAEQMLPKEQTIALYCRSGRRSKKAADLLTQKGYKVVELSSGFKGWTSAQKEIVKD